MEMTFGFVCGFATTTGVVGVETVGVETVGALWTGGWTGACESFTRTVGALKVNPYAAR